jgi:uncharacterized iron-regulated membrane protein
MFRKIIFWLHLGCGVCVGLVVLMMSVTGLILTYERQLLARADQAYYAKPPAKAQRLSLDVLIEAADQIPDFVASSITIAANPTAPVQLQAGRRESHYLNPYTGEIYSPRSQALDNFFGVVTRWHRWFNLEGEKREWGRAITGVSNLGFLFLVVSGLFLWLPKIYRWAAFKMRLWFSANPNAAARDFNWHHVFGIWAALPLLVIVPTATVFNYSWANNLIYTLAGEIPPQRGQAEPSSKTGDTNPTALRQSYESLFLTASQSVADWRKITLSIGNQPEVSVSIDTGNGGQPQKRHNLTLSAATGAVVRSEPFASQSAGRKARSWIRFLHTGEALGIVGQTVAGFASLAAVILVWTGLALALRRLQRYLKKRSIRTEAVVIQSASGGSQAGESVS